MGTRQLSDFQAELLVALKRPTLDNTSLNRYINAALRQIAYAFKFRELQGNAQFNTVNNTPSYVLTGITSDFRMMGESGVRIIAPGGAATPGTGRIGKLKKESRAQYLRRLPDTTLTSNLGVPVYYHIFGNSIYLRPWPDSTVMTLTFDYWKKITPLSNATDTSPLSEDWDDPLFMTALYRGHIGQGDWQQAINAKNEALAQIRSRVLEEDVEEFEQGGLYIVFQDDSSLVQQSDG